MRLACLVTLLLAAPAGPRVTMGIDPGFRTGFIDPGDATDLSPNSGIAVGSSTRGFDSEPILWSVSNGRSYPGIPGIVKSARGHSVNDAGWVVGGSSFPTRPLLWLPGEEGISLGGLPGGSGTGYANAINAFNEVVGQSSDANFDSQPFLWTEAGGMIDLTTSVPARTGGYAKDLNDFTDVVGRIWVYDK